MFSPRFHRPIPPEGKHRPGRVTMLMRGAAAAVVLLPLGGCCIVSCVDRPPDSQVRVQSDVPAACVFEDRAGQREFKSPGKVIAKPKDGPATLRCTSPGYKPYSRTLMAGEWKDFMLLSSDPNDKRYFAEMVFVMEPEHFASEAEKAAWHRVRNEKESRLKGGARMLPPPDKSK